MSKEEKMFRLRKAYEQDPLTSLEGLRETVAKSWIHASVRFRSIRRGSRAPTPPRPA